MASKINTKFVVTLAVALVAAGGILAAMAVLNLRNSVERNVRRGQEALAEGKLLAAKDFFGRVVDKDPGNVECLDKVRSILLQLQPQTPLEANTFYREYVGTLRQLAQRSPNDATAYETLLRELYSAARQFPSIESLQLMGKGAEEMWNSLAVDNPLRPLALSYQALATVRLAEQKTLDELTTALSQAQQAVDAMPDNDMAWSALCQSQMEVLRKVRTEGRSQTALDQQLAKLAKINQGAAERVPNGPESAFMRLRQLMEKGVADRTETDNAQISVAAQHVVKLLESPDADTGLTNEAVDRISTIPNGGVDWAIRVVEHFLKDHPDAHEKRLRLAKLQLMKQEYEAAEKSAKLVIDSTPLPTSSVARIQPELKRQSAGLIVDIRQQAYQRAAAEERPARMKAMEEAREALALLVAGDNDPNLLRVDAKIAYTKGDFNRAASLLDRLIRDAQTGFDAEIYLYSADSLERIGNVGLAYERLRELIKNIPNNVGLVKTKARLEFSMGRNDDALATIASLPEAERKSVEVTQLVQAIRSRQLQPTAGPGGDSTIAVLESALRSAAQGEYDTARTELAKIAAKTPDDLQLLQAMAQVEILAGQKEKAREYLSRALKVQPDDVNLQRIDAILKTDDPIDAAREFHKAAKFSNDFQREFSLMVAYSSIARQQDGMALQLDEAKEVADAAKAREIAQRARTMATDQEKVVIALNPDHPDLLEYQFFQAIDNKDWTKKENVDRAEAIVARAKTLNADQARGMFFKGRYEYMRGNYAEAVRNLESATDQLSFSAVAWRALASTYARLHNDTKAIRAYEQAYKCNPNDIVAAREYVVLLLKTGEHTRAISILQALYALVPGDQGIRDMYLDLEAEYGDRALVYRTRTLLGINHSEDRENLIRLAKFLGQTEPTREIVLNVQTGEPEISDQRWATMNVDDRQRFLQTKKADWLRLSDEILGKLLTGATTFDQKLAVVRVQSDLMRQRGLVAEGEQALTKFIATNADTARKADLQIDLSRYQMQSNHFADAVATLKGALSVQDPVKRQIDRELAMVYMQVFQYEQALLHVDEVLKVGPDQAVSRLKAECLVKLNRFDDCEKVIKEIVAADREDAVTLMLTAAIAQGRAQQKLAKNDTQGAQRLFAEQRDALMRAQQLEPENPRPLILAAHSYVSEYQRTGEASMLEEALKALNRAERIRATIPETVLIRVAVLKLKMNQLRDERNAGERAALRAAAITALNEFLARVPDNAQVRRELIQVHLDDRDATGAIAVIDQAIAVNPTISIWYEAKGDLYMIAMNDPASAMAAYAMADKLAPRPATLLRFAQTALMATKGNWDDFIKYLESRKDDVAKLPQLREAYCRALLKVNRRDDAIEQAKLAYAQRKALIAKDPTQGMQITEWFEVLPALFATPASAAGLARTIDASAAEAFVLELCGGQPSLYETFALARTWTLTGDNSVGGGRAIELQRKAIELCPPTDKPLRAQLQLDLSTYLLMTQDVPAAIESFKAVLAIDENNIEALNNLAYVLTESQGKAKEALPYAERAVQAAPESAPILDTIGYVCEQAGELEKARKYLEDSVRIDPEAITARIHLATVLMKLGDWDPARRQLDATDNMQVDPQTRQKISQLKDDIKNKRTPAH